MSKSNEKGDELEKSWSTGMQRIEVVKARTRAKNRFFHVLAARLKLLDVPGFTGSFGAFLGIVFAQRSLKKGLRGIWTHGGGSGHVVTTLV